MEPVVLVTGASQRIGATIARTFHAAGYFVLLHYRFKQAAAVHLEEELNQQRPNSTALLQGDIATAEGRTKIVCLVRELAGSLDVLIHNAAAFFPTPVTEASEEQWDDLLNTNLKGPFFLSRELQSLLTESKGQIIFLTDVYADRPLKEYSIYSISKAGTKMLMQALATDLAPDIRVNAVAPGAIIWPKQHCIAKRQTEILNRTLLKRTGTPMDIAKAVLFIAQSAYITGQNLQIDGGRSLNI